MALRCVLDEGKNVGNMHIEAALVEEVLDIELANSGL